MTNDLERKIIDFCTEQGILRDKLPVNPNIEFAYNIEYPPMQKQPKILVVLQPRGKRFISMQIATQVSPEHIKLLEENGPNLKLGFFESIKRYLVMNNLLFNIDLENNRFLISDEIFEDALTCDFFYRTIRKVFNSCFFTNLILMDILQGKGMHEAGDKRKMSVNGQPSKGNDTTSSMYYT
jgi:hypothetical protein